MTWQPDCGAPPPDPTDPAFLAATEWMVGTAADVDELVKAMLASGRREIAGGTDSIRPQLLVKTRHLPDEPPKLRLYALLMDFNTADDKHPVMRKLGAGLYEDQTIPLAACLIAEAWSSVQRRGAPRMEPRHDPARTEVLSLQAVANSGEHARMVRLPLRRDARNRMHEDGPVSDQADGPGQTIRCGLLRHFFLGFAQRLEV